MTPTIIVGSGFIFASLMLIYTGYLIRVKKKLSLIAGYDPARVQDKEGLAKLVGTGLQIMGGLEAVIGLLVLLMSTRLIPMIILGTAFTAVNVIGAIYLLINSQKYTKKAH